MMKQSTKTQWNTASNEVVFMKRLTPEMLTSLPPTQTGFVVSMKIIPPEPFDQSLLAHVAETFPASQLFSMEIRDMQGIWVELRNFLIDGALLGLNTHPVE